MMRVICQFKIWTIIVLSLFVLSSKGQVYQSMPQYGYSGPRFNMDSTLSIPTVCGTPTLKSNLTKKAAIAFDSCNGVFYQYNPKTLAWSQITGGGGSSITSTSSFGSFYDSTTQTITSTTTAYPIKLTKIDTTKGFRLLNNKIIADSAGVYNLQWSGQFQNTASTEHDATVWIRKNGVNVVGSAGFISIPKGQGQGSGVNGHTIASWNYIIPMSVGDSIVWYWQTNNTAVSLQYYPQGTNPTRPSTASVIVTITPATGGSGGGGSGNPAGSNGYVQFNNSGSFGADSSLFWNNTNKKLGIGTNQPQNKFDVISGNVSGGMNRGLFETSSFTKNGDNKVGIYNGGDFITGGASITFGHTKNTNSAGYYPGFEFQNGNDSTNPENSFMRYNYIQRDNTGGVAGYVADIMRINANGSVVINGSGAGDVFGSTPRLIVGDDNTGANFEVSGNAYIGSGLYVGSGLTSAQGFYTQSSVHKHVIFIDDIDESTYYLTDEDNVIIYSTNNDNAEVYLPNAPQQGQEIIIKQSGATQTYQLFVNGNGHDIWNDEVTQSYIVVPGTAPHSITLIYDSTGDGFWYVLTY